MKLLEPFAIGDMSLKNRMVMPPMVNNYGSLEGYVTERTIAYYQARAEGGVGLIIVEATCVDSPRGLLSRRQLTIDDDKHIPGLRQLAAAIHKHGARAAIQLHHAGSSTSVQLTGQQPVAPSPVPIPREQKEGVHPGGEIPRELTVDEIKDIIGLFTAAALRAKKAGFDAVEIHACHTQLLAQFLSSVTNQRRDGYGGDLRNRARMLLEILTSVKQAIGDSCPVWCRIDGEEAGLKGGITIEDAQQTARLCQETGASAIHVSQKVYGTDPLHRPLSALGDGYLIKLAGAVKRVVSIPVIAVGQITPALGEEAINGGKADLIAMGRQLLCDPQLPNKVAEGRMDEITPCIVCNTCQYPLTDVKQSLRCRVNPALGREKDSIITRASKAKKIVVIGGGPAGMEAAIVAAQRGHRTTLFEKSKELGGQLVLAAIAPYKDRIARLTRALTAQAKKSGVAIKLGKTAAISNIVALSPDAVILAAGGLPFTPDIPGIERNNVVFAEEVIAGRKKVGPRVVVIGGELVGCETAELLADAGKKVTITRRGQTIAADLAPINRGPLVGRMKDKGVTMLTGVRYEEVTPDGLVIINKEGSRQNIAADTIVLAAGSRPNTDLLKELTGKVPEVYQVGDCLKPRSLLEALEDGFHIGRAI